MKCHLYILCLAASFLSLGDSLAQQPGELIRVFTHPNQFNVSAAGANVLIAAHSDITGTIDNRLAYLFDGNTGAVISTFNNPDPDESDEFGRSMAGVGDNVLIGAPFDDTGANNAGSVYLFDGETGALTFVFNNPDPDDFDLFGYDVAAVGDNILIGAPLNDTGANSTGSAYLYNGNTGALIHIFNNPEPVALDHFGVVLAGVGTNALISARTGIIGGMDTGVVYLFDGSSGALIHSFNNPDLGDSDGFGRSLAGVGDDILIGARLDDTKTNSVGSAYLFDGNSGGLLHKFSNPDPTAAVNFGASVAGVGKNVLIGAPADKGANTPGSAYLFDGASGVLLKTFSSPVPGVQPSFGGLVAAVGNDFLIVGGDAYLFQGFQTVSLPVTHGIPGATTIVHVSLDDAGGFVGGTFNIKYDPLKLRVDATTGVRTTALTSDFALASTVDSRLGEVSIVMANATPLVVGGISPLLKISFEVDDSHNVVAGDVIRLTLDQAELVIENSTIETITPLTENGHLEVIDLIPGDVDLNGVLEMTDVILILKVVAGTATGLDPFQQTVAADTNEDGVVDVADAMLIQNEMLP